MVMVLSWAEQWDWVKVVIVSKILQVRLYRNGAIINIHR